MTPSPAATRRNRQPRERHAEHRERDTGQTGKTQTTRTRPRQEHHEAPSDWGRCPPRPHAPTACRIDGATHPPTGPPPTATTRPRCDQPLHHQSPVARSSPTSSAAPPHPLTRPKKHHSPRGTYVFSHGNDVKVVDGKKDQLDDVPRKHPPTKTPQRRGVHPSPPAAHHGRHNDHVRPAVGHHKDRRDDLPVHEAVNNGGQDERRRGGHHARLERKGGVTGKAGRPRQRRHHRPGGGR